MTTKTGLTASQDDAITSFDVQPKHINPGSYQTTFQAKFIICDSVKIDYNQKKLIGHKVGEFVVTSEYYSSVSLIQHNAWATIKATINDVDVIYERQGTSYVEGEFWYTASASLDPLVGYYLMSDESVDIPVTIQHFDFSGSSSCSAYWTPKIGDTVSISNGINNHHFRGTDVMTTSVYNIIADPNIIHENAPAEVTHYDSSTGKFISKFGMLASSKTSFVSCTGSGELTIPIGTKIGLIFAVYDDGSATMISPQYSSLTLVGNQLYCALPNNVAGHSYEIIELII